MKKKLLLSIIPVVIILGIVLTLVIIKPWKAKADGKCTIIVKGGNVDKKEEVSYYKNDTLSGILEDKFDATFSGTFMTSICKYTPDTTTDPTACEYWAVYVNDEYSMGGVKEAELKDKNVYKFVIETYDSTASWD